MKNSLLWLSLIFALGNWLAVGKQWKRLEYFTKPAVILAIIAWMWNIGGFNGPILWFMLGLVFSLAGDIFLLLPSERFTAVWITFLFARLSYVVGLNPSWPSFNFATLSITIIVGLVSLRLVRIILAGLISSGNSHLQIYISIYSIVISVMLLSALLTLVHNDWLEGPALMVSAGGILFFISDSILALNRFVASIRHNELIIINTRHLGQVLIITAACLHYVLLV